MKMKAKRYVIQIGPNMVVGCAFVVFAYVYIQRQNPNPRVIKKQTNKKHKRYISKSLKTCALIDYGCGKNEELFQDSIGCGCQSK